MVGVPISVWGRLVGFWAQRSMHIVKDKSLLKRDRVADGPMRISFAAKRGKTVQKSRTSLHRADRSDRVTSTLGELNQVES